MLNHDIDGTIASPFEQFPGQAQTFSNGEGFELDPYYVHTEIAVIFDEGLDHVNALCVVQLEAGDDADSGNQLIIIDDIGRQSVLIGDSRGVFKETIIDQEPGSLFVSMQRPGKSKFGRKSRSDAPQYEIVRTPKGTIRVYDANTTKTSRVKLFLDDNLPQPSTAAESRAPESNLQRFTEDMTAVILSARNPEHQRSGDDLFFAVIPKSGESEDTVMVEPNLRAFGVFDGVGGSTDGRLASQAIASAFQQYIQTGANVNPSVMIDAAAKQIEADMTSRGLIGMDSPSSTGTFVKINEGGRMDIVHFGDCAGFIIDDKRGSIERITQEDDLEPNMPNQLMDSGIARNLKQHPSRTIREGQILLLVSDGIFGDGDGAIKDPSIITKIFKEAASLEAAVNQLLGASTKYDDKSVVAYRYTG